MSALLDLFDSPKAVLAGLVMSALVLLWIVARVRRIARSERPDEALSNVAMLIGLGWSSEAVWELTGRAEFPISIRLLLFFVLETLLVLSMIRAKRAVRELGHPGRSGRTAWIIAAAMSVVAAAVATSFAEGLLRLVIPLLVTNAWWDGLVGEGARRREDATSWRWTPRRLLLWLGAIEPGERDVETVHREQLTQQMTRLEFRRRHSWKRSRGRAAAKLARLSLTADDEIVAEVRRRVDRATWFEPGQVVPAVAQVYAVDPVPAGPVFEHDRPIGPLPAAAPSPVDNLSPPETPARKPHVSSEDRVVKAHRRTPDATNEELARRLNLSTKTVSRYRPKRADESRVNGRTPEFAEGVTK